MSATVRRGGRFMGVAIAAIFLTGCSQSCKDVAYMDSWIAADRIVVKVASKTVISTVTDKTVILKIAEFIKAHGTGWGIPFGGTPIARLSLDFYDGTRFLGHLGIGQRFLEAQGCDGFVSRSISTHELSYLTHLLDVSDASHAGSLVGALEGLPQSGRCRLAARGQSETDRRFSG